MNRYINRYTNTNTNTQPTLVWTDVRNRGCGSSVNDGPPSHVLVTLTMAGVWLEVLAPLKMEFFFFYDVFMHHPPEKKPVVPIDFQTWTSFFQSKTKAKKQVVVLFLANLADARRARSPRTRNVGNTWIPTR